MAKMESIHIDISKLFGQYVLFCREGKYRELNVERRKEGDPPRYEVKQRVLAEKVGVSAQFLGKIEKGEVPTPDDIQAKLIVELKIPVKVIREIYMEASVASANRILGAAKDFKKAKRNKNSRP